MSGAVVKLGLMPPLSGLVGIYGSEIVHAAQVACQEINENGGVLGRQLELIIEDDGSLPESAVSAAEKLVDQHHCSAIIGNLLSNSRIAVAYRVAEPRKIPLLNFSFYEGSILSRYFFHFAALPNQQIDQMIPYMAEKFGRRIFFAGNNYEWPRGSIDAGKKALMRFGGEVVGEEYCPIGVEPEIIESLLDHVEAANPDVFVPYFAGADQVMLLTRFTERGLKKRIAVVMGHYDEMMASQLAPEIREGFYSSNTYFMTVDSSENRAYLQRLAKLPDVNGVWPQGNGILTNFGEGTYACVKAFAQAVNQAGSLDAEVLVETLKTIAVASPQGILQMNPEHHHAKVNTYLTQCDKKGVFNIVEKFGAISPVIPERYSHQRITNQTTMEDDIRLQARILEQMSEGVLLTSSQDGSIVYANAGAEDLFGYDSGEMIGLPIAAIYSSADDTLQNIADEIISILTTKGEWRGEVSNIKKDGTHIWCSATVSTFTHPVYGEVWLGVQRDITQNKQNLASLAEANERFRLINSRVPGIVYQYKIEADGSQSMPYVSPTIEKYLGLSAETAINDVSQWFALTHPDDLPGLEASIVKSLQELTHWEWEGRFVRSDGQTKWLRGSSVPVRLEDGSTRWDGVFVDVSERVKTDLELLKHRENLEQLVIEGNRELFEREQQLKDAQRIACLGSYEWDLINNRLSWSDTVFDLFGLDPENVQPSAELFMSQIHPDDAAEVSEKMNAALNRSYFKNGDERVSLPLLDYRAVNKAGKVSWVRAEALASLDDKGRPVHIYGTVQDVSSHKQAEQEITRAKVEAERANQAKSVFLSNMSHELRTPLNAILGFAQLLKMGKAGLNNNQNESVTEILKSGQHLLGLINEVLDLAKIESGNVDVSMEDVQLDELILSCMNITQPLTMKDNLEMINNVSGKGFIVRADKIRLKQVLLNLLSNAAKYNRLGGGIKVDSKVIDKHRLRISVTDSGEGMSDEDVAKLFVPFQRLNAAENIEGTGIGLVIAKQLIELMDGLIGVESKLSIGSTFWFELELSDITKPIEVHTDDAF